MGGFSADSFITDSHEYYTILTTMRQALENILQVLTLDRNSVYLQDPRLLTKRVPRTPKVESS